MLLNQWKAARGAGVPIVGICTADQDATVETLAAATVHAVVQWDAARGITAVNETGGKMLTKAGVKPEDTVSFVDALTTARGFDEGTNFFVRNAHRQLLSCEPLATAAAVQAVANLRGVFKRNLRTLALLAPQLILPTELEQDVIILHEPLPGPEPLGTVVTKMHEAGKLAAPEKVIVDKAVDALSGLSLFTAEQVTAMSLTEKGMDLDALWERKRLTIEQTRGLRVWRGGERFADLCGLENIKDRLRRRLTAKRPVGVVLFIDEIDKALANVEHDTSGVRMDQLRTLLTEMEDNQWPGLMAVGVPGAGKSAIAKAFGAEAGVPTIALDLGDMEGPHVGESEMMLRQAMKVIKAVGRGNAFVIATSNNMSVMRPELQRRFTAGTFFFDLTTVEERAAMWALYAQKYELPAQQRPADDGWTGAEIRNCCLEAWDTGVTLIEAAKHIVPMAQSRAFAIDELRQQAHGKFLNASAPGVYNYVRAASTELLRRIELPTAKEKVN